MSEWQQKMIKEGHHSPRVITAAAGSSLSAEKAGRWVASSASNLLSGLTKHMAIFALGVAILTIAMSSWMLRFSVTPIPANQALVVVHDRWTGETILKPVDVVVDGTPEVRKTPQKEASDRLRAAIRESERQDAK